MHVLITVSHAFLVVTVERIYEKKSINSFDRFRYSHDLYQFDRVVICLGELSSWP